MRAPTRTRAGGTGFSLTSDKPGDSGDTRRKEPLAAAGDGRTAPAAEPRAARGTCSQRSRTKFRRRTGRSRLTWQQCSALKLSARTSEPGRQATQSQGRAGVKRAGVGAASAESGQKTEATKNKNTETKLGAGWRVVTRSQSHAKV